MEAIALHEHPRRELKLQAIRIGELGITAIPNEVYGITGRKLKAQSPLVPTFNVELAGGSEGYIPPPSQHALGGYTTWPARSAGLEVQAEPKIVAALLELLEEVSGRARRQPAAHSSAYADAVMASRPSGYWRLDDFEGPAVADSSGARRRARFEGPVAYCLPGRVAQAAHLAGGWLAVDAERIAGDWSAELWFNSLLPANLRALTGVLLARGGQQLTIGAGGKLTFDDGATKVTGRGTIEPNRWYHLALVRSSGRVQVYLDGRQEIDAQAAPAQGALLVGGGGPADSSLEGKIDEVAFYGRPLSAEEIGGHARP